MTWQYQVAKPDDLRPDTLEQIGVIYETSFSPALRESYTALITPVMTGTATLYLASLNRTVGGFALTAPLSIPGVNYLSYFAVDPAQRGQGIGGVLFRFLLDDAYRRTGDTELLWEVERPEPGAGPDDPNRRRIAFYRRHGGVILDHVADFRMPNLAGPGTVPAALMWTSLVRPAPLTAAESEAYVVALFADVYGRDRDDALVMDVVRSIRVDA